MKTAEVMRRLGEIADQQWGLVTTAQAVREGVTGVDLQRARKAGAITTVRRAVYRVAGAPEDPRDQVRAAWLASEPRRFSYERLKDEDPVVVTGATAAWLHDAGDLNPEPYELTSVRRRQSRSQEVRYRRAEIDSADVQLVDGLPVTTPQATVIDLMRRGEDVSLVADVLREIADDMDFPVEDFRKRLLRCIPEDRADHLLIESGIDEESRRARLTSSTQTRDAMGGILSYFNKSFSESYGRIFAKHAFKDISDLGGVGIIPAVRLPRYVLNFLQNSLPSSEEWARSLGSTDDWRKAIDDVARRQMSGLDEMLSQMKYKNAAQWMRNTDHAGGREAEVDELGEGEVTSDE